MATPSTKRNRRPIVPIQGGQPSQVLTACLYVGVRTIGLVFREPVYHAGPSLITTTTGAIVTAYDQFSDTEIDLTLSIDTPADGWLIVPAYDPGIRTQWGGYAAASWYYLTQPQPPWVSEMMLAGRMPHLAARVQSSEQSEVQSEEQLHQQIQLDKQPEKQEQLHQQLSKQKPRQERLRRRG